MKGICKVTYARLTYKTVRMFGDFVLFNVYDKIDCFKQDMIAGAND